MLLRYDGLSQTARRWTGQHTGTRYWFGLDESVKYVDVRDGIKFLLIRGDKVFLREPDDDDHDEGDPPEAIQSGGDLPTLGWGDEAHG